MLLARKPPHDFVSTTRPAPEAASRAGASQVRHISGKRCTRPAGVPFAAAQPAVGGRLGAMCYVKGSVTVHRTMWSPMTRCSKDEHYRLTAVISDPMPSRSGEPRGPR